MKALPLAPVKLLQNSKFSLFGIAGGLTAVHLILTWKVDANVDRLIISVLFWGAILCLLQRKQNIVNLESGIFSSFFGLLLIVLVLFKSVSLFWFESSFLKLAPLLLALGLALLASGFKGLNQYWRELMLVLLLCLPEGPINQIETFFHVTTLTAKFATFFFWYLGFEVANNGAMIHLANGSVLVGTPCTGTSTALLLLRLSGLFILMFSNNWSRKILVPIAAVLIAFVISGIRVILLAALVSNDQAFAYWHGPVGNQMFSTMSILVFGLFCHLLLQSNELASPDIKLQ